MFNQSSSMKQLLGFGAVAAFLLLGTSTLTAQQKIAHINVDTIILRMNDYAKAIVDVNAYGQQLQNKLKADESQLVAYAQQVQAQADLGELTPKAQNEANEKIQKMRTALQVNARKAEQQLAQREQKLMGPVYVKFNTAMKAIAAKEKYSYIANRNMFLFLEGGIDATQAVADYLKVDLAKPVNNVQAAPKAGQPAGRQ